MIQLDIALISKHKNTFLKIDYVGQKNTSKTLFDISLRGNFKLVCFSIIPRRKISLSAE